MTTELSNFENLLFKLFKARFPCLYISTWEEERALTSIRKVAGNPSIIHPRAVYVWSVTGGMIGEGQSGKEETRDPLKALEFAEKCNEAAVFVFKDFHVYFGGQGRSLGATEYKVIRKIRDLIPLLTYTKAKPKNVIFLSPTLILPNELQKDVTVLDFDLPTIWEIKNCLSDMIERNKSRINIVIDNEGIERLANAALGLTLKEAENAFARAMVEDGKLSIEDLNVVLDEKCQIIKKTEILELIKSDLDISDVGGLENMKRWLIKRKDSWLDYAQDYGLPAPKGLLITGVPGCGKSLISKAISSQWGLPLLRLDIGKIFSGIVGSSEENMRRAIKTAEAISPSILWIDEIEKGFISVGGGGDSGTSSRVFGSFLTWMQEKTKPVFVVATANNIHSLPPEFLRKGRFDEIFFVDLPTRRERCDIFLLHMEKRLKGKEPNVIGNFSINQETALRLAEQTEGFVGAEIEQIVISGLFEAFAEKRAVTVADFEKAIKNTVPLSVTQAEQIRAIREWANIRAVAATTDEQRAEYSKPSVKAPILLENKSDSDVTSERGGRSVDF